MHNISESAGSRFNCIPAIRFMKLSPRLIASLTLISAFLIPARIYSQGSLTPPGAPAPTMKTLDQVEARTPISSAPYNITNAGSYYLTTNITLSGLNAILISTNNVALDLNGFTLAGAGSSIGIFVSAPATNITVRNGILKSWTTCIHAGSGLNCQFENLQLTQSSFGMVLGDSSLVSRCNAFTNASIGIATGEGCRVMDCIARFNGNNGIQGGSGCNITGCVAENNGSDGIMLDRGIVKDCVCRLNNGSGINAFINCRVINNNCLNNHVCGINMSTGGHVVDGNTVVGNGFGIGTTSSTGNLVIRNSASGNATNYFLSVTDTAGPVIGVSTIATNTNPHANFGY